MQSGGLRAGSFSRRLIDVVKEKLKRRTQWGDGPLQYLEAEATRWTKEASVLIDTWTQGKLWIEANCSDTIQMKERAVDLAKKAKDVSEAYKKEFVRDVLGEFASLKRSAQTTD